VVAELAPSAPAGATTLLWLIPALPLAAAMINLFLGRRLGKAAGLLAIGSMLASLVVAVLAVRALLGFGPEERLVIQHLFDWISVGTFQVGADLRLDAVSATMILVVTGVGSLITVYATAYMAKDPRFGRFFAYLTLFVAFMLLLVLGQNFLLLYLGWEGVGLCSYLLIGFWYEVPGNAEAAKKAFITTRIGDTFMLAGIALIAVHFGTLDFDAVFGAAASTITQTTATVVALLLFAGAIGKSAQIPLHVWLPDAMAGPTPVSALIHAATMVTAGVYLVVRTHALFELSGVALTVVLVVGLVTMLFAGLCALAQWDIKRVLAYSTISQLGFMFMAAGMRAYGVAMFFLVAHAFYKALMFLSAGSVIHGMHDQQDLRRMGGLRKVMPVTFIVFLVGGLSQAGVPPLAGYFAKDAILEVANHTGRVAIYVLGTLGACISAAYIGRMLALTFFGPPRSDEAAHAHESPPVMTVPLAILAVGAAAAGLANLTPEGVVGTFLEPVAGAAPSGAGLSVFALGTIASTVAIATLALTWLIYGSGKVDWLGMRQRLEPLATALQRGLYVDRAYDVVIVQPAKALAGIAAFWVDARIVDGVARGIGGGVRRLADRGRLLQTGFVRSYALVLFAGAIAILAFVGFRP
jgi:NADH-quinone oxidoreductase subunit L